MIEERGADHVPRLGDALGEDDVLWAWRRIPTWMIVNEDERARPFPQHDSKRIARRHVNAVETARRYFSGGFQVMTGVYRERPELFVLEGGESGPGPTHDLVTIGEGEGAWPGELDLHALSQLDRRGETRGFCQPHSFPQGELAQAGPREPEHSPVLVEQRFGEEEDRLARAPRSEKKRDELRTTERLDARRCRPLPRAILN